MDQQYWRGGLYEDGGFNFLGYEGSSEGSTSPVTSTPMTRGDSGGSAITTYSGDLGHTYSAYGANDPPWSPFPVAHNDIPWSPVSYPGQGYPFPPTPYDLPAIPGAEGHEPHSRDDFQSPLDDPWWDSYDFITEVEQQPYWRLKPGITPTSQLPLTRATSDSHPQTKEGRYICMEAGCPKTCRRKSDLERHYLHLHTPPERKAKFPCDWKKCQRAQEPFHRQDHQRDHYRDFHHEDLVRRRPSKRDDQGWWDSRQIYTEWWRCSHCLRRVRVDEDGYTCLKCKTNCEKARQNFRAGYSPI